LSSKYQEEYRKIRIEEPTQEYILQANKRAQAQKNFIQNNMESITDNAKILEIGCAAGSLLMQFQCETNNLFGFEPDLAMSHFAKKMLGTSSTIWNNIFNIDQAKENKYDLIMASHVLEHVPNPNQFIKDLISILSEKGHIFFEVPNESVLSVNEQSSHCLKGLMHLWFFQPTPLIRMIENAGGKIINIASYGPSIKYFSHFPVSQRGLKMKLLWKIGYLLHKLSFGKLYRELLSSSLITADSLNQIAEEEGIWIRVLFVKGN
jgi:2-polyprenyl-3-methyl-5-hydroxy-6-metoxy-1,4-benzoquinol methylase